MTTWSDHEDTFIARAVRFKRAYRWISVKLGRPEKDVRMRARELCSIRSYGHHAEADDSEDMGLDHERWIRHQTDQHGEDLRRYGPLGTKLWRDVVFAPKTVRKAA